MSDYKKEYVRIMRSAAGCAPRLNTSQLNLEFSAHTRHHDVASATVLAAVDSRQVVRCDKCRLVQFRTPDNTCRRCHSIFVDRPEEVIVNRRVFLSYTKPEFNKPPLAAPFLLLLIPKKHRESILGDLEEEFRTILLPGYGVRWARFYWLLACGYLRALFASDGLRKEFPERGVEANCLDV